jgi:hypothetical protein
MNGSWYGLYTGTNSGLAVVEIDDRGDYFEGSVYAYNDNFGLPHMFGLIKTSDKKQSGRAEVPLSPLDPRTGEPSNWAVIKDHFEDKTIVVPTSAYVDYEYDANSLALR